MKLPKPLKRLKKSIINWWISNYIKKDKDYSVDHELPILIHAKSPGQLNFKKEDNPDVSIIIPVYNQWEYTISCLSSILENTQNISFEIILADDGSEDKTREASSLVKNIKIIKNKEQIGFLKNCNNASKYSKGKYILFLNNDTNVQKGWLDHLLEVIDHDKKIGIIGPKFLSPNGRILEAGGITWKDASTSHYGYGDAPGKPEYNYVKEVDYISGACLMIRKKLWEAIGGFDEQFAPCYYEDTDLAFAGRNLGYKVIYQPKSVIVHFEGITNGIPINANSMHPFNLNREKFLRKWENILAKEHHPKKNGIFTARERNIQKKTILVVADKPQFDEMTRKMLKMGLNIKILINDFYRYEPFTSNLEQSGIEVLYGYWYNKNIGRWLKNYSRYFDYIYSAKPQLLKKYFALIKKTSRAKIINFSGDLI